MASIRSLPKILAGAPWSGKGKIFVQHGSRATTLWAGSWNDVRVSSASQDYASRRATFVDELQTAQLVFHFDADVQRHGINISFASVERQSCHED